MLNRKELKVLINRNNFNCENNLEIEKKNIYFKQNIFALVKYHSRYFYANLSSVLSYISSIIMVTVGPFQVSILVQNNPVQFRNRNSIC